MTREQHLLTCLAEECAEVAQRCSKAIRFGMGEVQPDQPYDNRARIQMELGDLMGVADMLGIVPNKVHRELKEERVERYMKLSVERGEL